MSWLSCCPGTRLGGCQNSSVCFYFSRAQRAVSVSLLDVGMGGQWQMNFCGSSSLVAQSIWDCLGSWGEPCTPREQAGGRDTSAKPEQWVKGAGSPVLSCTPLGQPQNSMAQGKSTSCACVSRHLCSWTFWLTGRKWFLLLQGNWKRGLPPKHWMPLKLCCMLFLFTRVENFACHPTDFALKSSQPLEYWNVAQMWLDHEEKGRYKTRCRV